MSMTRLILVRHGETLANRDYRYLGARDDLLTDIGKEQAAMLADALAILPVVAVYSSPLQRAYQTALPIAEKHKLGVQVEDALREGSFGIWEGLSRAEVLAQGSERELRNWEADPEKSPPGGESFADLQRRATALVRELVLRHPDQTIILVAHVGPIKVLLCEVLGAPLKSLFQMFLDPATISVADWRETRPTLRLFNSHAHLGWERGRWML